MAPLVSYIVPTHDRKSDLRETVHSILEQEYLNQEIIIVSDSTDGTEELFTGGPLDREEIRFHQTDRQLGPSSARNIGIEMATGKLYVFLDDDAVFADPSATNAVVDAFEDDKNLGVLAFCIRDYYTGELNSAEFPHRMREPSSEGRFHTTYFVGAGCAIRPAAIEEAGTFSEYLERFEEVDLAFRIINAGYSIEYVPAAEVKHKNAPVEERAPNRVIRFDLENRMMTAVRNLLWRHVLVSLVVWSGYTLHRARLDPRPLLIGLAGFLQQLPRLLKERSAVGPQALHYLEAHGGRLYY